MAEPILWAHKAKRTRRIQNEEGEWVTEKIPQWGHDGGSDYDDPKLARGQRWIRYITHDGNEIRAVITSAAAHLDPHTDQAAYVRAKARQFGWFPTQKCPVGLMHAGELMRSKIVDKTLLTAKPCERPLKQEDPDKPCPHALSELAARRAIKAAFESKRNKAMESEADKLVKSQREQTGQLVEGFKDAIGTLVESLGPQAQPMPKPDPKEPPKK